MTSASPSTGKTVVRALGIVLICIALAVMLDFPGRTVQDPASAVFPVPGEGRTEYGFISIPARSLPSDSALGISAYGAWLFLAALGGYFVLTGRLLRRWPRSSTDSK